MSEYDINTYRELASNAIEDLKNYADDGSGARLMTSYRAYTKDLERIDNTRAVPDVTELVRYSSADIFMSVPTPNKPKPSVNGEYVLYSQAAAIIAAKDAEIERLREKLRQEFQLGLTTLERAEAAEAKLAQHEAKNGNGDCRADGDTNA